MSDSHQRRSSVVTETQRPGARAGALPLSRELIQRRGPALDESVVTVKPEQSQVRPVQGGKLQTGLIH